MDIIPFIFAVSQNVMRINIFFSADRLKVDAWKPDLWTLYYAADSQWLSCALIESFLL